jgi:hypothetical protein
MIDQISGWSSGKIGEGYGDGYDLITVKSLLVKMTNNIQRERWSNPQPLG